MAHVANAGTPEDFADAFGNALNSYVQNSGIQQNDLVDLLGLDKKIGKSRISTYCREGRRVKPDGEMLWLALSKLPGFHFDYRGHRISAAMVNGNGAKPVQKLAEQLTFEFERQFKLTDKQGTVAVKVRRPHGRIEVSISLDAKAS
jgi:hypothetical protein